MNNTTKPAIALTPLGPIEYILRKDNSNSTSPAILAIHGAMGGYEQSDILGRTIGPSGYNYIGVSRPGYLKTPLAGRDTPEAQADMLAALLESLHIGPVIVFAISGGGYSALHFALRHPKMCRALVLCSTTGGPTNSPVPFAFNIMKIIAKLPFLPDFMGRRAAANIGRSLKKSITYPDILAKTLENKPIVDLYRELLLSTMTCMAERLPGTINDINITRTTDYPLPQIQVPTLVVHGSDDPIVPFPDHGKILAEQIPGARLCLAERGEHAAIFTHNEQVRTAVAAFLQDFEA